MSWQDALFLEKNEEVIKFWRGDYEARMTAMEDTWLGKQPTTVKQKKNGMLVLTNRKLVWIEERGFLFKSYHPVITIPLENLRGISMGGAIMKYVSIADTKGEYVFHLSGVGNERKLRIFKAYVFNQVDARKQELETEKKRARISVLLDFSFLKSYMEKGGLIMQTVKCPNCGAPIKLPQSGNQTECEHCGSSIYAQDIFEKVKALIG